MRSGGAVSLQQQLGLREDVLTAGIPKTQQALVGMAAVLQGIVCFHFLRPKVSHEYVFAF